MSEAQERKLFDVAADGYDRLMGRYLPILGVAFADAAGVRAGQRVLDVGCGPGGLTSVLVERVGADAVAAIDPSGPFVAACRQRNPGVDVRQGVAEQLPYDDDTFDASLACLVVGFLSDRAAGAQELRRVTVPGGAVAMCFWTLDRMPLLNVFWEAVGDLRVPESDDAGRFGRRPGQIANLLSDAGFADVVESEICGTATYADFGDWWSSFTGGAGPVGAFQASLTEDERTVVQSRAYDLLGKPDGPFTLEAWTWCAVGKA